MYCVSEYNKKAYNDIINNKYILHMKKYKQHGSISTYDHCINVLHMSYFLAKVCKCNDEQIYNIIIGSMLHDFYLYDWHTGRFRKEGIHGFTHPVIALDNANKLFTLNKRQKNIIKSHMFPMTIFFLPKYKESWIVTIADKYCALIEYLSVHVLHKKIKLRHMDLEI